MEGKGYSGWIILELFGRQMLAGLATEELIAGTTFLRLDVPGVDSIPGFTKLFGGAAIYAVTPTTEEIAKQVVKNLQPRPIEPWIFSTPQLSAPKPSDGQLDWDRQEED